MKPLSGFCSINPNCPEHGNRDGKNLRVHQMYALRKPKQTRNGVLWGKKEEVCQDEEKEEHGDQWEHVVHVVIDAESKAVISLVTGKRTKENTDELIGDFARRVNEGNPPLLFTTDDYPCYKDALVYMVSGSSLNGQASQVVLGKPIKPNQICSMLR